MKAWLMAISIFLGITAGEIYDIFIPDTRAYERVFNSAGSDPWLEVKKLKAQIVRLEAGCQK
jgi:hypothetical protein